MDKAKFFDKVRDTLFGGKLTASQVSGMEGILLAAQKSKVTDIRFMSYIFSTAYHETGAKMIPVREGFAASDASARRIVAKYKYSAPDPKTGHVYYGRGQVQLTWAENYKTMGRILGIDLYNDPDLALDPFTGAQILVEGMIKGQSGKGDFTGLSLSDFFNDQKTDPVGARKIINGTDKATMIADYYYKFFDALKLAGF